MLTISSSQEVELTHYIVRFFKTVTGDNGYVAEVRQFEEEVLAESPVEAQELGIQKFCEEQRLSSWSLRADRISVQEAEFPS